MSGSVDYSTILDRAAAHHGGTDAVLEKAKNAHAGANLEQVPDDRWLSTMTRCVFCAGFNWKVIDAKWPGFEEAFVGFDPRQLAFMGEEMLSSLVSDERIVRNGQKIKATLANAQFICAVADAHGSFGKFLAHWDPADQFGLMEYLNKHGSRLGGATAQFFLRFGGWDAWIASPDGCKALYSAGALEKPQAKTKRELRAFQSAINALNEQSGQPRAVLSRLLSLSVG